MTSETRQEQRPILSPQERRERNRQEMRDAILAVARDIMRAEGVAALNLSEIARRLQVTTAALYRYFPSKVALYDALFRLGMQLFQQTLDAVLDGREPSWDLLQSWFEAQLAFAKEHPDIYELVFERPVPGFVPSDEAMAESRAVLNAAVDAFRTVIDAGVIAPGVSPERAFDLFIIVRHGLISQHLANEPELAVGQGRFGSLIPDVMALLHAAWAPSNRPGDRTLCSPDSLGVAGTSEGEEINEHGRTE